MLLYLLRHGESEGNKDGKFRGRTDFPLTERGKMQAEDASHFLGKIKISRIYSSPLIRASKTAEIISRRKNIRVKIDERFNNIFLGDWENRYKTDIKEKFPDEWKIWVNDPENLNVKGMETLDSVRRRTVEAANELCRDEENGVLIVTHRAVIKPLISGLLNINKPYFWRLQVDTASLSILELIEEGRGWMLRNLNINHYLKSFEEERF